MTDDELTAIETRQQTFRFVVSFEDPTRADAIIVYHDGVKLAAEVRRLRGLLAVGNGEVMATVEKTAAAIRDGCEAELKRLKGVNGKLAAACKECHDYINAWGVGPGEGSIKVKVRAALAAHDAATK